MAVIVIAVIAGTYGFYLFNKKVPTLHHTKADFELTADDLFNAFDADENAALAKYGDKVLSVSGEVVSVKMDEKQNNITLKADMAMAGGVNCSLNERVENVKVGDTVKIKGRCQGFLLDVILSNCNVDE